MQKVDRLLIKGYVLTMNDGMDTYSDGAVAIKGAEIVAVGPTAEIVANFEAPEVLDCSGQVIMPGLVNAHTHLSMTLMRGLADDLRLDVWLMGYIMPAEKIYVNEEFVYLGAKLALAELILSGTTCFADMYYFESEVARAAAEVGVRGLCGQTILKFPSPDAESYEDSLAYTEKFIQQWKGHSLVVPSVAPHAPYTSTDELLQLCADLAHKYDVPVIIHVAETKQEVEDSRNEFGMPVVPRIKKMGILDHKCLCAHCVHIDSGEIRTLRNHNAGVSHNPTSNLKLASGIAPVKTMLDQGVNVGIGTDGTASNNDLDMFTEIHLAALLAKVATNDPTTLPAKEALLMATRLGAQACHVGDITGSLEVGKRADIIMVNQKTLHNTPFFSHDPDGIYGQLVYSTKSTDVAHVMCNGVWLMRDRQLLTIDLPPILEQAQTIAVQIDKYIREYSGNIMSKLLSIASFQRQESFEIQLKTRFDHPEMLRRLLEHPDVQIVKETRYRQYDTYFLFNDGSRVRYREDDTLDEANEVTGVRTRLTYTSPTKEREFDQAVLLSHSQFYAPADRPLRFYHEYFRGAEEREITKERRRWSILYKGVQFYVNLDNFLKPKADHTYLEIKSRTWSMRDAEYKASLIAEMLSEILQVAADERVAMDYVELAGGPVAVPN
ncbi:MAG: 5-methylthioadenosine/S-adenosylhomocysteine deaminase [Chloroflexota bacterium]|nr:amidohydrolase [Chloroflexota bacterium]NOG64706.1 amidohydrolase [Chloroflexota bacterium]GIK66295.1 MAG: 5-methylthioadenosine/S-adenosylhomocysteine deaminase [Chloroflexota bacterium]